MKATDFLTWFQEKLSEGKKFETTNAIAFYSTPFKPEHITEFFEGWRERQREVYAKLADNGYTDIIEIYFDREDKISYGNDLIRSDFPDHIFRAKLPQTLNDFISDCSRAGIELTFKPEIVERYFI